MSRSASLALLVALLGCDSPALQPLEAAPATPATPTTCAAMIEEHAGDAAVCGLDGLLAACELNDLSLEDVLVHLGLLPICGADELCCRGTCVSYEDAESHGC